MGRLRERAISIEDPGGETVDAVASLTDEMEALKEQVIDLRRRLGRLERQAGRGVPHPSERAQE